MTPNELPGRSSLISVDDLVSIGLQVFSKINLKGGGKKETAAGLATACEAQTKMLRKLASDVLAKEPIDAGELRGALMAMTVGLGVISGSMGTIADVLGFGTEDA